ncbi:MAG: YqaA family protein [Gammaproteobacteria bacterium]
MSSDPILTAWGLFLSAFVSATLVPGSSEVLLAYLALNSPLSPSALLLIATAGNSLGAITTWGLGFLLSRGYPLECWRKQPSARALQWVQRWGVWSLLLSWLPVLGDALCLAAGAGYAYRPCLAPWQSWWARHCVTGSFLQSCFERRGEVSVF